MFRHDAAAHVGTIAVAQAELGAMIARHGIDLIAIGSGTAGRETEKMVADLLAQLPGKKPMKPMAGRGATLSRLPPAGCADVWDLKEPAEP